MGIGAQIEGKSAGSFGDVLQSAFADEAAPIAKARYNPSQQTDCSPMLMTLKD